jgi:environmental stress-induced protein Ves
MRVLQAANRIATPWKNGRGLTREIAAHPAGAGIDDFLWRVSMATVDTGGPFSVFPGIDRILTVLSGRMALSVQGMGRVLVDSDAQPFAFPGDAAADAVVLGIPVEDLNVMVRRGHGRASVERLDIDGVRDIDVSPTTMLLFHDAAADVECGSEHATVGPGDALLFDAPASSTVRIVSTRAGLSFLIRLPEPAPPSGA